MRWCPKIIARRATKNTMTSLEGGPKSHQNQQWPQETQTRTACENAAETFSRRMVP
jgi:hypothetical protein